MDKWVDDLYGICENVTDELSEAKKKLDKSGGKMTAGDLDYIDKLTHTLKSIKTTLAMEDYDNEYSSNYSGARGRGKNARRDSMGRYSNDGRMMQDGRYDMSYDGRMNGYSNARRGGRGYSREDAKADMVEQLHELKMSAPDDETRRMIDKWIRQAEND